MTIVLLNLYAIRPPREVSQCSGGFRVTKTSHSKLTQLSLWTVPRYLISFSLHFLICNLMTSSPPWRCLVRRNPGFSIEQCNRFTHMDIWSFGLKQAKFKDWFHGFLYMLLFERIWPKATTGTSLPSLRKNRDLHSLPYQDYPQQGEANSPNETEMLIGKKGGCWVINVNTGPLQSQTDLFSHLALLFAVQTNPLSQVVRWG